MRLLFGTTNKSKIIHMKAQVKSLGIEILGLDGISAPEIDIDESGNNPLENAEIKAKAYYKALRMPVFSCDSGLYIEGLDDLRQPGVHVRRIQGKRLSDDEMIAHYTALAKEFGGNVTARYQHAICLVLGENQVYSHAGEDIASERFLIVSKPHTKRSEGFPLDSLSVDLESGEYYYDMGDRLNKLASIGFRDFFERVLMQKK